MITGTLCGHCRKNQLVRDGSDFAPGQKDPDRPAALLPRTDGNRASNARNSLRVGKTSGRRKQVIRHDEPLPLS